MSMPAMSKTLLADSGLLSNAIDPASIRGVATPSSPEHALIAAIVARAFTDARGIIDGVTSKPKRQRETADAKAWLADTTAANAFGGATLGLRFCAEVLERDPEGFAEVAETLTRHMPRMKRVRANQGVPTKCERLAPPGPGRGRRQEAA